MSPSDSTTVGRIATQIDNGKNYYGETFCELRSWDVAMATNFVTRDGDNADKLVLPVFIVCDGILQRLRRSRKPRLTVYIC